MKCPYCGSENNNTSGFHKKELRRGRVRRWRRCFDCGEKFTTIEFYVPERITTKPMPAWVKKGAK